jgi:hypothetical protein
MNLVTLRFTDGGPLDGHELVGQRPLNTWINVDGGRYRLTGYTASGARGEPAEAVTYRWHPADSEA